MVEHGERHPERWRCGGQCDVVPSFGLLRVLVWRLGDIAGQAFEIVVWGVCEDLVGGECSLGLADDDVTVGLM